METKTIDQRIRTYLLLLTAGVFLGTPVELWAEGHFGEPIQWVPFVISGLALAAVIAVLVRPNRQTIQIMRVVMGSTMLAGVLGIVEHIIHNIAFEMEIRPNAAMIEVLGDALQGANPLLAPGILTFTALVALIATYYHPALARTMPTPE